MATITLQGNPVQTIGELPSLGSKAPAFTITKIDLSDMHLSDYAGKMVVLNIFPSLDTPTCAKAMMTFNDMASKYSNVAFLCISADLPFAQKRFCVAQHLGNVQPASVFRHPEFGDKYGVTIADGPLSGLLSRAVVVLNEQGHVIHCQQVNELADEPDYNAIAAVLR